jgi:hypothetical protein
MLPEEQGVMQAAGRAGGLALSLLCQQEVMVMRGREGTRLRWQTGLWVGDQLDRFSSGLQPEPWRWWTQGGLSREEGALQNAGKTKHTPDGKVMKGCA